MSIPYSEKIEAVGSIIEVFFWEENQREIVKDSLNLVKLFEQNYSRFKENNQLSALNKQLNQWHAVSDELFYLLKKAWEYFQLTDGFFDISVIDQLERLGYDNNYSFEEKPKSAEFKQTLSLKIEFAERNSVKINKRIELGGLGKGYILDFLKNKLSALNSFLINAGGDIYAANSNQQALPWKIALENPLDNNFAIGETEAEDLFFAASSPSKRKWKNYHHLINPKTGLSENALKACFVQAKEGILADAMATALFVMGIENAQLCVAKLGVEALLIDSEGQIYRTSGFKAKLYQN